MFLGCVTVRGFYRAVKRFLDVTASFLGLVLLSPLLLAVSILIKIDSRGPVIFRQKRIGRNGKVFEIYKFRSMCVGAENRLRRLFRKGRRQGYKDR